jgi:hypothetical protein
MRPIRLPALLLGTLLLAACARERKKVVVQDTTSLDTAAAPAVASPAPADPAPAPPNWRYMSKNVPGGFDSSTVWTSTLDPVTCLAHPRYVVLVQRFPGGSEILVRPSTASPPDNCGRDSLPGDLVIRRDAGESFIGLHGDQLFLDSGTGSAHDLVVYDIPTRRKVATVRGYEFAAKPDSSGVSLWVVSGTQPRSQCPYIPLQYGVGVDSLFALDFNTLVVRPLGASRCAPRQ